MTASRRKRIKRPGELEIIRADGPAYQALIGRAVADAEVYESVHGAIKSLFDEGGERACTRAIEVATHLGDRGFFARYLAEHLLNTPSIELQREAWLNQGHIFE